MAYASIRNVVLRKLKITAKKQQQCNPRIRLLFIKLGIFYQQGLKVVIIRDEIIYFAILLTNYIFY